MASSPGSNAPLTRSEGPQAKKSQRAEEAIFYKNCRAAYLTVFKSSLENIKSKEQLTLVLQQAGRSPSQKTVDKYWTSQTTTLNFDNFCTILKEETPATKTELLEAFGKIDADNTGCILHEELYKILTTEGEKMTLDEVSAITELPDFNCNGKLDYRKFCDLYMTTSEQCCRAALEKLDADNRLRHRQFGSGAETSTEGIMLPASKPSLKVVRKTDHKQTPTKVFKRSSTRSGINNVTVSKYLFIGDSRTSSRPSSAQSCKASTSCTISVCASSSRSTKLIEPNTMKEWQCAQTKGCFYLEEDGEIISHKYRLQLSQRSAVCITIQPLHLRQGEGCRLKKVKTQITGEAKLVYRDEDGELALTKEFRAALLDIFETIDLDGNGLLSLEEYNFFELRTSGEKCDEEAWAVCKENFDMKKNELTRQGFMDLNLMEANDREGDPSDLWVTLLSLGYNKALEMTEACPFVIDIYAEKCKPRIKAIYLEAGGWQLNRAVCKSAVNKGDAKVMDGCENIIVYTYRSGMRITSVIENKSENKVIVHVNNEQSRNCLSNRGLAVFAVEVAPKSMTVRFFNKHLFHQCFPSDVQVSQHVMPLDEQEEWLYDCVHSLLR
ncbi:UNVERIFIED_CONTAM: hypothetical protein H355_009032 [Colinus virginianus]|nr:hypothetical protein H355_009032 [Colinus virginianus]